MHQFSDDREPHAANRRADHSGASGFTSANHVLAHFLPYSFSNDPLARQPVSLSQPDDSSSIWVVADCSRPDKPDHSAADNSPEQCRVPVPRANHAECAHDGPDDPRPDPGACDLAAIQVSDDQGAHHSGPCHALADWLWPHPRTAHPHSHDPCAHKCLARSHDGSPDLEPHRAADCSLLHRHLP